MAPRCASTQFGMWIRLATCTHAIDSAHGKTMCASPLKRLGAAHAAARDGATGASTSTPELVLVSPICTAGVLNVRVRRPAEGRGGEGE